MSLRPLLASILVSLLAFACAAPVAPPVPTNPTVVPASTPAPATQVPAPAPPPPRPTDPPVSLPTVEPSATVRLQSQQDGPVHEPVTAAFVATPLPTVAPLPRETITPADQCDPNAPPGAVSGGFASFRTPLPPTPLYNPPGAKRVGLQAGHWLNEEVPPELGRLQHGTVGGGKMEWEANLDIAYRAKEMLEAYGYEVDVLPAAVPIRYQAHAFISIHADGDAAGALTGYKMARPGISSIPEVDDHLIEALYAAYGPVTGLRRDDEHITNRMRFYYAFNARRYCHAVAPGVPQAIVETGFLTSALDRRLLIGNPDLPARGIAEGVHAFFQFLP